MSMRVTHEQCPRCRAAGHDTRKDNLGVWADGGKYCFACGYSVPAREITVLSKAIQNMYSTMETAAANSSTLVTLPEDIDLNFSEKALRWLRKYDIYEEEILTHNICYSPKLDAVVFPYYITSPFGNDDDKEDLVAYQVRLMESDKWMTTGPINDLFYLINKSENLNKSLVIVEDILSAIKVGRTMSSVPLFGSSRAQLERMTQRAARAYTHLIFWLDKDAQSRAVWAAQTAPLYSVRGSMISTDEDPKFYTSDEISHHINKITMISLAQ